MSGGGGGGRGGVGVGGRSGGGGGGENTFCNCCQSIAIQWRVGYTSVFRVHVGWFLQLGPGELIHPDVGL